MLPCHYYCLSVQQKQIIIVENSNNNTMIANDGKQVPPAP